MCPIGIKVFGCLVLVVAIAMAAPYSWGIHQSNYDASLDPIVWSRDFVKDSIRRPRQFRTNSLLHNTLDDGGEDAEMRLAAKKTNSALISYGFGKRHSSKVNYAELPGTRYAEPSSRKLNAMRKKFYRRRQKLDARDRYGFV